MKHTQKNVPLVGKRSCLMMSKVKEAVEEASISVACLFDAVYGEELQKDVEHIQDQLKIIENFFEEVSDEN